MRDPDFKLEDLMFDFYFDIFSQFVSKWVETKPDIMQFT